MTGRDRAPVPGIAPPLRPARGGRGSWLRSVGALILREMSTTHGRSAGGYLWAFVQPVALIAMLTIVFSLFLRSPSLGTNFVLFYTTGLLPLRIYQEVAKSLGGALSFNRALLGYPRVTFADSILARGILAVLTQLMVFGTVMGLIFVFLDVREILDYGPIVAALALAVALGVGAGVMNCFLFTLLPSWSIIWGVITRPLIFVSGIFYIYEELPPQAAALLWYNPMLHVTGLMRRGVYATYDAAYVSIPYVAAFALIPLVAGLLLLRQYNRDLMYL